MMKKIICLILAFSLLMSNFSYARIRDKYRPKEIDGNAEFVTVREARQYFEEMTKKIEDIINSIYNRIDKNEGARIKRERAMYENDNKINKGGIQ